MQSIDKVFKLLSIFPPLLIITLSIFTTSYVYMENQNNFEAESLKLKKDFLDRSRNEIYNDVYRIYNYINSEYSHTDEKLRHNLRNRVNEAYSIIMGILNNNSDLSKEKKIKLIKDALRDIRFNQGRGYYYMYSMKGTCVLLPIQRNLEGKSFLNVKDKKGKYITRSIIESLRNGNEEFINWWWYKPSDINKQYKKISFNKYIKELDMYIGTGDYIDDFEKVIKERVLNYISKIQYGNSNYIFLLDYSGNIIFHSNPKIIGKNLNELNNTDKYNLKEIISMAKLGEGYISYKSDFFGKYEKDMVKTSFIKGLDKWEWVIGTGFYKNDLENQIIDKQKKLDELNKNFIIEIISISILVTIILILILIYNVKFLKDRFNKIQKKIKKEIKSNNEKDKILFHQSKMASLGEMLQNIAHQWRQPLSIISTAASGMKLKKDYKMLDDNYIDESVNTIMKSTVYLSKTIDDFKDFFVSDKTEEEFNIKRAVIDTLDILNIKLVNDNVIVILDLKDCITLGFKNELIQVLMNIICNSLDAFEENDKKYIFITMKIDKNNVLISLKDNAGGISDFIIDRVFEPYFTTKHKAQGTGIGLYMSQEIVTKHLHGRITVKNTDYEFKDENCNGVDFVIKLPIKKGQLKN